MVKFEWKNVEFNIVDMLKFLLKKIKIVFVITLLFALLVPGVKYGMDMAAYTTEDETAEQYEQLSKKLEKLQKQLERRELYIKESYIMNLDYTETYVGVLQLYIDVANDINEKNVSTLIKDYCSNGGLFYDIANDEAEIANKRDVIEIRYDENESQLVTSNISITVYGADVDNCKALVQDIKSAIAEYSVNLSNAQLENNVSIINEIYYKDSPSYVKEFHTNYAYETQILKDEVAILTNEIEYKYGALAVKPSFSVKMLILGGVLGAILATIVVIACYLFSNKVKYSEEISEITNLNLISEISEEQLDFAAKRIKAFLKANEVPQCCMVGPVSNKSVELINIVLNKVNAEGDKAAYISDVDGDEKSFDTMINSKRIILIVENWKTDYSKIKNIISFCQTYGCEIVGYIVL